MTYLQKQKIVLALCKEYCYASATVTYIHEPLIKDSSSRIFQHFEQYEVLSRVVHRLQL